MRKVKNRRNGLMKSKSFFVMIMAIALILSGITIFFGCTDKEEFPKTEAIDGLKEITEKGILYFEWLGEYDEEKPVLIVFHGETEDGEDFTINLNASAYGEEVTYLSENINAETIGLKGNGLKKTEDGKYYDTETYWLDTAEFNVAIIHAEKFFNESSENIITKIYTSYKSRYIDNGKTTDCNFGYSMTEIISVLYKEEMDKKKYGNEEIRFVGYGTGANLALSCAYYLYDADEKFDGKYYLPSRVTMCDPYLSGENAGFSEVSFSDRFSGEKGTVSIVAEMSEKLSERISVIELVESEEVNGEKVKRAYESNVTEGAEYEKLLSYSVAMDLAESYSLKNCYAEYKDKKRIAFDWYIYSIIGSDDSVQWTSGSQKYAVGYPHEYKDLDSTSKTSVNWGPKGTRPILNNRKITNDVRTDAGASYGKNFGVGAWTPTAYLAALKGVKFEQREAGSATDETNEHGISVYNYENYVLPTFKSENYQYSELNNNTVVTGLIYVDENTDGIINDGDSGMESTVFVTVYDSKSNVIISRTRTETDKNGRYTIYVADGEKGESEMKFTAVKGGGTISGFSAAKGSITIDIELYTPKGYTAEADAVTGMYWYENMERNAFAKGIISIVVSKENANSAIVKNCLIAKNDK